MKEFIEKLIVRLREKSFYMQTNRNRQEKFIHTETATEIVNQIAEEYKPKTQADKIRSMSDEELADYIIFIGYDYNEKIPCCKSTPQCTEILDSGRIVPNKMCRECLVKWLQSEVE